MNELILVRFKSQLKESVFKKSWYSLLLYSRWNLRLEMASFGQNPKTQNSSTQNSFGQNFWTQNPKTQFWKKKCNFVCQYLNFGLFLAKNVEKNSIFLWIKNALLIFLSWKIWEKLRFQKEQKKLWKNILPLD